MSANEIADRLYSKSAPKQAPGPIISDDNWLYKPHPEGPQYAGHWVQLSPERAAELRGQPRAGESWLQQQMRQRTR